MAAGPAQNVLPAAQAHVEARPTAASVPLPPRYGFYARFAKRFLDLALGAALLALLLPLMAAVALAILVRSGYPVLYASERIGLGGRRFRMWKFRTMVRDADAMLERWKQLRPDLAAAIAARWKLDDDPRVTRLGAFLRRSSLDELPQIWNVLRGEMSIVGPRPYLSREDIDPALAARIRSVKPGLTGPFQTCGRSSLTPNARVSMEAAYAGEMSLARDVMYMLRTAKPLITLDGR